MKQKSSSLQRRVQCYLPPGLYKSVVNYAKGRGISSSEAAVQMMRSFFETLNNTAEQCKKASQ